MKNIRKISIILVIALLISFASCAADTSPVSEPDSAIVGAVMAPKSEDNDIPQQTYIADLKIVSAYWDRYACNAEGKLKSKYGREYELCEDANLNRDCGTTKDCIYLYESRTVNEEEAITHIIAINNRAYQNTFTASDGCYYEVVGGIRINGLNSSTSTYDRMDLNMNGGGAYIYIYVTHDTRYSAITDVTVGSKSFIDGLDYGYYYVRNYYDNSVQDFNEATSGSKIYIAASSRVTGWEITYITLKDYDLEGKAVTKKIKIDTQDKTITEEMLLPFVTKNESCHFVGYYDMDHLANIKTEPGMSFEYDKELWARWEYDITVDLSEYGEESFDYTGSKFPSPVLGRSVYMWYYADTGDEVTLFYKPGTYRPNLF